MPNLSASRSRAVVIFELALLILPIAGYVAVTGDRFWTPPSSADPQNYLKPVLYHDMSLVSYPDRLMVSLDMFLTDLVGRPIVPDVIMRLGAFHALAINALTLLFAVLYCYRAAGLVAGAICAIFLAASYNFIRYSNEVYPDIDMTLHTVLAGAALLSAWRRNWLLNSTTLCGFFCATLALCKPTAIASIGVIIAYLFILRRSIVSFIVGGLLGLGAVALLCLAAFDHESIRLFFANLTEQLKHSVDTMTFSRAGVAVSVYDAVVWTLEFPLLLAPFVATRLWRYPAVRFWFTLAITHLLLLALLIGASNTLRSDNYIYYHTAVACVAIGLAIGLAQRIARGAFEADEVAEQPPAAATPRSAAPRSSAVSYPLAIAVVASGMIAFGLGLELPQYGRYPSGEDTPVWFRTIFAIAPLALLTLLMATNFARKRGVAFALLFGLLWWTPYLNVAHATESIELARHRRRVTIAFAREAEKLRESRWGVSATDFARHSARRLDEIERVYFTWWGQGFERDPALREHADIRLQFLPSPDDVLTRPDIEFVVADAQAWEGLGERQQLFKVVREWSVDDDKFLTLQRVDPSFVRWTEAVPSSTLIPTLRAYSFKGRKPDAVRPGEVNEMAATFELNEAGDVRIVTGAGPYNRKPRESCLALPPGAIRVKLAGETTGTVRVARVTLVFADESGEISLVAPRFQAGERFNMDGILLATEVPPHAATFRVMLHVHGTGTLTVRQLQALREAADRDPVYQGDVPPPETGSAP